MDEYNDFSTSYLSSSLVYFFHLIITDNAQKKYTDREQVITQPLLILI